MIMQTLKSSDVLIISEINEDDINHRLKEFKAQKILYKSNGIKLTLGNINECRVIELVSNENGKIYLYAVEAYNFEKLNISN